MDTTQQNEIRTRWLNGTPVAQLAREYAVSQRTISRITHDLRNNQRKTRADAGQSDIESSVTDKAMQFMLSECWVRNLPPADAIRSAIAHGHSVGRVTPDWLSRYIRTEHAMPRSRAQALVGKKGRKRKEVVVYYEAEKPNQLHHFDATPLKSIYLSAEGDMCYEPASNSKKKQLAKSGRVNATMLMLTDDHSRVKFARVYDSESAHNVIDFLVRAWGHKPSVSENPFCGIPTRLYFDNGSGANSRQCRRFYEKLGLAYHAHLPYEPWGKGKVERAMQYVQRWESMLSGFWYQDDDGKYHQHPHHKWQSFDDANIFVDGVLRETNAATVAKVGVPMQRWLKIDHDRLKICPPAAARWGQMKQETVKITRELWVSFDSPRRSVQLPRAERYLNCIWQEVTVEWHPFDLDSDNPQITIILNDGSEHREQAVTPTRTLQVPEYVATPAEQKLKELAATHKVDTAAVAASAGQLAPIYNDTPMGRVVDLDGIDGPEQRISRVAFVRRLQAADMIDTPPTPEQVQAVDRYVDAAGTVAESAVETFNIDTDPVTEHETINRQQTELVA